MAALGVCQAFGADSPLVILDNAKGIILADPTRCVGCLRCELACTEFNDGRAQPSLARIKISRVMNFGQGGPTGGQAMQGAWGRGLVVQGRLPPMSAPGALRHGLPPGRHPGPTRPREARVVDQAACIGCRLCQRACPWDMIVFRRSASAGFKMFSVRRQTQVR